MVRWEKDGERKGFSDDEGSWRSKRGKGIREGGREGRKEGRIAGNGREREGKRKRECNEREREENTKKVHCESNITLLKKKNEKTHSSSIKNSYKMNSIEKHNR